ncbi:MAG: acyl-CoA thioester hydrolase/BAAT C-terminal domain-containing protein [Terracidiphilus sp.]
MKTWCFAFFASLVGAASTLPAQKIQVVPAQAMADQPASIIVTVVAPGSKVTIRAELADGDAHTWAAQADFFRAQIAVEATNGPILMIGGEDDGIWPSAEMVRVVARRLRSNHFSHLVVALLYPHAGHRAGLPDIAPTWSSGVTQRISGRSEEFGGSPRGNAESSLDATPKVLDFLATSLGQTAPPTLPNP